MVDSVVAIGQPTVAIDVEAAVVEQQVEGIADKVPAERMVVDKAFADRMAADSDSVDNFELGDNASIADSDTAAELVESQS